MGFGPSAKVYLPRYLGGAQPSERLVVKDSHLPRVARHECVLVVEDDPKVRCISLELLSKLGYQVLEAESGKAALKILEEHPEVTVLFTDVVMPEMTGKHLAGKVGDSKPSLPVLYTTGYTRNAIMHNGMLDRGVTLLHKPFTSCVNWP